MASLTRRLDQLEVIAGKQTETDDAWQAEIESRLERAAGHYLAWRAVLETMSPEHQALVMTDLEREPLSWLARRASNRDHVLTRHIAALVHKLRCGWHSGPLAIPPAIAQALIATPGVGYANSGTDCESCGLLHPSVWIVPGEIWFPVERCELCGGRVLFNGYLLKHGRWLPSSRLTEGPTLQETVAAIRADSEDCPVCRAPPDTDDRADDELRTP